MLKPIIRYAKVAPEKMKEKIDYIQNSLVYPLIDSMSKNSFAFVSDRLEDSNFETARIVAKQKSACHEIVNQVEMFSGVDIPKEIQDQIFSFCSLLLPPTLKFGYAEEATRVLHVLLDPALVGEHSKWNPEGVLKQISATLGRRYQRESAGHIKYSNHDFINDVLCGQYGEQKKPSTEVISTLKFCFNNPESVLDGKAGV